MKARGAKWNPAEKCVLYIDPTVQYVINTGYFHVAYSQYERALRGFFFIRMG